MNQHIAENLDSVNMATQPITLGLAGMIFMGYPVQDWLTLIGLLLGLLNILWVSTRLFDWVWLKFKQ